MLDSQCTTNKLTNPEFQENQDKLVDPQISANNGSGLTSKISFPKLDDSKVEVEKMDCSEHSEKVFKMVEKME